MPVYTRRITFPLQLTARDADSADRDARDLAESAAQRLEDRDPAGALSVGKVTVTIPFPEPTFPRWTVVYGHGEHATAQVLAWLAEGAAVDSRIVRGLWVHRPVPGGQSAPEAGS